MPKPAATQLDTVGTIGALLMMLDAAPPGQAIGVCAAYLFNAIQTQPVMLRTVLNEPVVKHGFIGASLLAELTRVARG